MYPDYWIGQKMINVPQAVRERLGLDKYVSFLEIYDDKTGEIKFFKEYEEAHQKMDSKKSEFDKKLIKFIERHQVIQAFFTWQYFKVVPIPNDPQHHWAAPFDAELLKKDSVWSYKTLRYLSDINDGAISNDYTKADKILAELKAYQRATSPTIVPSERHVKVEIAYNKMHIFKNVMLSYLILGLILLTISFIRIFKEPTLQSEKRFKKISIPFIILMVLAFIYHGIGLGMRWYVSGHAPWSDGYEAVVFIAWAALVSGFMFAKKNHTVLAVTAILAFFMIFITELNLLDPEISPLEPVLKSYWLMIHVAIITSSYGFLGLGAIIGLLNMVFFNFRTQKNGSRLTANINELSYVSEITMEIGLFMLFMGTFLGGVWANESWGRYWGWDPKETWALVSVLVYSVVLHLRFIPKVSDKLTFNIVSFWAYSAIIFTFLGVNFYLVGLHSYAQGDGLAEFPMWIFWMIVGFYFVSELTAVHYKLYRYKTGDLSFKHFANKFVISALTLLFFVGVKMYFLDRIFVMETLVTFFKLAGLVGITLVAMFVYSRFRINKIEKA
jgi:cytochrome c-type biogenesis protein CcsB